MIDEAALERVEKLAGLLTMYVDSVRRSEDPQSYAEGMQGLGRRLVDTAVELQGQALVAKNPVHDQVEVEGWPGIFRSTVLHAPTEESLIAARADPRRLARGTCGEPCYPREPTDRRPRWWCPVCFLNANRCAVCPFLPHPTT